MAMQTEAEKCPVEKQDLSENTNSMSKITARLPVDARPVILVAWLGACDCSVRHHSMTGHFGDDQLPSPAISSEANISITV